MTFFADSGDTPITISGRALTQIAELPGCCAAFLRQASPGTRAELAAFLDLDPAAPRPAG